MNAIKYTPPGGTISIEVEPEGDDAVMRVRDTGVGISPELLPRVFELFVQSERGLERRDGGLGVGLSIARSLVEAHGGRIEARSPVRTAARSSSSGSAGGHALSGDHQGGALPAVRILIVDDNVDAREALARLLEMAGHEVAQAGDGPSGFESASRLRPDVAIVDIGLPGMNGFELARRLGSGAPNLRLIALTGYGQTITGAWATRPVSKHISSNPSPSKHFSDRLRTINNALTIAGSGAKLNSGSNGSARLSIWRQRASGGDSRPHQ